MTDSIWQTNSDQETVERFAHWAAGYWQVDGPKDIWNKLRILPKPFKPNKEPISFLSGDGLCTEFVAAARWVLGERFRIERHDLLFPSAGHSAISVQLTSGRWVFIDPYLGWIFKDEGRLLSLDELRERLAAGKDLQTFAVRLKDDALTAFYPSMLKTFDAKASEILDIHLELPLTDRSRWSLGEIDGDWQDVQRAGMERKLTSHFFYLGRRFPANYRFRYQVPKDGRAYQLIFHLTEPPSPGDLPAFSLAPEVSGKTVRFHLGPRERTLSVDTTSVIGQSWYAIDRFEVFAVARR